ncbi:MAG TPA: tetratricopeptide repeat protein [Terriglobales bacterium]|nr:tetratricopeptide repeat protein [Terriglobales bacterium]
MAAASSSGTNQELTLDRSSFEKLLAAAWVLQCLHDQLHPSVEGGKAIAQPFSAQEKIATASSRRPVLTHPEITKRTLQPLPVVIDTAIKPGARIAHSADNETLTELVKTQEAIETGILELDATVKRLVSLSPKGSHAPATRQLVPANRTPVEVKPNVPAQSAAEAAPIKASSVLEKLPDRNKPAPHASAFNLGISLNRLRYALKRHASTFRTDSALRLRAGIVAAQVKVRASFNRLRDAVVRYQAAFRVRTDKEPVSLGSSFNLQRILRRLRDACIQHTSTFRINLTLRSLRAVAIATPVWLLVMIASLLLLETWLHQPFQGARAMSAPSPATAQAAMSVNTTTPAHSTRPLSQPAKRIESTEPRQFTPIPRFAASHDQIPDPATASVVAQLSRFEIKGLQRRAKFGDDSAAFTLGMVYEIGRYVRQNCAEGARWVTMAAEAGDPAAQYDLGLRYRDGDGVAVDLHESEKWLRKAAAHRYRNANLALQLLASR